MRDYIKFYVNGKFYKIADSSAFLPLTEYLRNILFLTGTKEACKEGDCGACTVLVGKFEGNEIKYKAVNSCITYIYQLDNCHVITIEGLKYDNNLNPVQEAIAANHGTQCGFCTPGIVTTLYSLFEDCCKDKKPGKHDIQEALSGNLCRCTGYEPIINSALKINNCAVKKLNELYSPNEMKEIFPVNNDIVVLTANNRKFIQSSTLEKTLQIKSDHPDAFIISGGTDVHVLCNKRDFEPKTIINLANIQELNTVNTTEDSVQVGAVVNISRLERQISDIFPELRDLFKVFASPQIKNIATLAGNIANGSPVGDTIPFLMVMEAKLTLARSGHVRTVNITDFYKGYKAFDIRTNEIITHISIPIKCPTEILRLYKVSKRRNLDISSFSAAIRMKENKGIIESIAVAFGGVGPTVQRVHCVENFLKGKKIIQETFEGAASLIETSIKPISDVRGSDQFRYELAKNCLMKFYTEIFQENQQCQV